MEWRRKTRESWANCYQVDRSFYIQKAIYARERSFWLSIFSSKYSNNSKIRCQSTWQKSDYESKHPKICNDWEKNSFNHFSSVYSQAKMGLSNTIKTLFSHGLLPRRWFAKPYQEKWDSFLRSSEKIYGRNSLSDWCTSQSLDHL